MIRDLLRRLFRRSDPPHLPHLAEGGNREYILTNHDSLIYDLLGLLRYISKNKRDPIDLAQSIKLHDHHLTLLQRYHKNHDLLFALLEAKANLLKEPLTPEERQFFKKALKILKIRE